MPCPGEVGPHPWKIPKIGDDRLVCDRCDLELPFGMTANRRTIQKARYEWFDDGPEFQHAFNLAYNYWRARHGIR